MAAYDYAVVGGGIVGLAVAWALAKRGPRTRLLVLEKEETWARHQTGRNSGVIHAGIYYQPGTLKARLAREGNRMMVGFCREQGIRHEVCGKLVVATEPEEQPLLEKLYRRAQENGIEVQKLVPEQVREIEPHVNCVEGIRVPSSGIVDFREVCLRLVEMLAERGIDLQLETELSGVVEREESCILKTSQGDYETKFLINCAGLQSDRVVRMTGAKSVARIVPFRGEYYELVPERRSLVRHLIYPVPNPRFPFLGVHFTRMIDGSIHAGPNAVLSFNREGYGRWDFNFRDMRETLGYPGFWRLAARNVGEGWKEVHRSLSKRAFVRSLRRLVPEVRSDDLVRGMAGIRAQALYPDGRLVDDFLFVRSRKALHVCNSPSPAATASLAIANRVLEEIPC